MRRSSPVVNQAGLSSDDSDEVSEQLKGKGVK